MSDERISIIGLGQAGCSVLDCALDGVHESVSIVAIDTDRKALAKTAPLSKLQLGKTRCRGLGVAGDAKLGFACAEDDLPNIRTLVSGADLVILVSGLGGGTAGAAPLILDVARDCGALTLCFGILPASFEGASRRKQADELMARLRISADAIIAVPNDRMLEHVAEEQLAVGFSKANELIAAGLRGVWQLLTRPGFIGLTFADIRRVAHSSGGCTFGVGEGRGRDRAAAAVNELLGCPTLDQGEALKQARSVLVSIAGGSGLALKEVGDIMGVISASVGPETEVMMGTVVNPEWRNRVSITALVTGSGATLETEPVEPVSSSENPDRTKSRRSKRKDIQAKLRLDTTGKGRFKDVEPTFMDGEDLDIPTFIRRDIRIEK